MSSPLYKKALIIGATSGIGEDLAAKFISQGTRVIVVGRRQERLDQFVSKHGKDSAAALSFDITKLSEIPNFVSTITQQHPDLDAIILNSGIQRAFDFSRPETVDLSILDEELTTNYTSYVHLTVAFLPFLQKQNWQTHLVYIGATLGLVPSMLRTGNYNAAKAALHHWILVIREQLKALPGNNVKVVEVFPPAVQTELHDERHQPDLINGGQIGMPLKQFTDELYDGLLKGEDQVGIGPAKATLQGFEAERQKAFHGTIGIVNGMLKQYQK